MNASRRWEPTADYVRGSHLERVMARAGIRDYRDFYRFSIDDPAAFWAATLGELGIEWTEPYRQFVDLGAGPEWPRWFVGGRLNAAHNAVTRWVTAGKGQRVAIQWEDESGRTLSWTYAQLEERTARAAAGLRAVGVRPGDRVGLFVPLIPEAAAAFLAVVRIGAVTVPMFSGYGAEPVAVRMRDCGATVLVTADGFTRRGRYVDMKATADEALRSCPGVRAVVVIDHAGRAKERLRPGRDLLWDDLLSRGDVAHAEAMDANDPMMIVYTSGTTGKPKGAVHVHGGFPFKMTQDLAHLMDLRESEVLLWITDMGWLMGPGLITCALTLGATAVFFTGAPDWPDPSRVWSLVEKYRVTHLGLAPTLIRALRAHGHGPIRRHDLSSLRILPSTGEPWDPESYVWYSDAVGGGRLPISNYSGGTEVAGGILGCVTHLPIPVAGFNTAVPGVDAAVLDTQGAPLLNAVGELAMRAPIVGMTQGFWLDRERYLETYWRRFPGVWVHGDWALRDDEGDWFLYGRSDDTIKAAGKRIGPAEIEGVVTAHPRVRDAAAIGVPDDLKGSSIVLFVVARDDGSGLERDVAGFVSAEMGRPLAPKRVHVVASLPYTRTGKLMRRAIRAAYVGGDLGDISGMDNPDSLDGIRAAAQDHATA